MRRARQRGSCPTCGKVVSVMRGTGPYADGRDEGMPHKRMTLNGRRWCSGGIIREKIATPPAEEGKR